MKYLFLLLLLFLPSSCAGKAKWYIKDVAPEKREWRWCSGHKDSPELAGKGICYVSQKCKKRWLRKPKCKRVQLHCAHGDIKCLRQHGWPRVKRGDG